MFSPGQVVKSIAGHDKDHFHMVVAVEGSRVYIADGKARKLLKPKAKNALHLAGTKVMLDAAVLITDKKLRQALHAFCRALEEEGG